MAAHPNGGHNFAGDITTVGDVTCQNVTASAGISAATVASTSSYFSLVPGVTPGSPAEGQIFGNAANHHLYYYNGSAWVQLDN